MCVSLRRFRLRILLILLLGCILPLSDLACDSLNVDLVGKLAGGKITKSGKREYSYSLGCALCQCGVPCEGVDPYNEEWRAP